MSEEIKRYWENHFPDCMPVSYLLRQVYSNRWFRIHTLPKSKRYPESEDEFSEILFRHNTICSDLFSNSTGIHLLLTEGSFTEKPKHPRDIPDVYSPLYFVLSVPMHEIEQDNDLWFWHIWSFPCQWSSGMIDNLFRKAAIWQIVNLILLDSENHRLYCPYDGGADIILWTETERDSYKRKYQDWLSRFPSGL